MVILFSIILGLFLVVLFVCGITRHVYPKLLYFPEKKLALDVTPAVDHLQYEDVFLTTSDHVRIHAWWMKTSRPGAPTMLYFHGNAGYVGTRIAHSGLLLRHTQINVLLIDYRGYGLSEGDPSERGLQKDADAALAWVRAQETVDKSKIYVYGQSLGGAVAIWAAHAHPSEVAGIVLENTFTSLRAEAAVLVPKIRFLVWALIPDVWNSAALISKIRLPLLVISGRSDEMIPPLMCEKLFSFAGTQRKQLYMVPQGMHNDTWARGGQKYYEVLRTFMDMPPASPLVSSDDC
ncbi:putative Serine protease [Paratrimastix pyriformis]|uniref:Serine protease n=1 Tax=Paratrimastix pyriformis TaxID=342808 RepID=A0ABQ8UD34_9EUKA|nr:putative Serine protease [Paratrimastix pyriformis]|eukprot:GAFH01002560.1.p1 GENE.GAFH01002560.1~~GAFH01002560.1.p1  ORF type:complete len:303 (+),score=21.82 GAFH01002560.1:38-910(+)